MLFSGAQPIWQGLMPWGLREWPLPPMLPLPQPVSDLPFLLPLPSTPPSSGTLPSRLGSEQKVVGTGLFKLMSLWGLRKSSTGGSFEQTILPPMVSDPSPFHNIPWYPATSGPWLSANPGHLTAILLLDTKRTKKNSMIDSEKPHAPPIETQFKGHILPN